MKYTEILAMNFKKHIKPLYVYLLSEKRSLSFGSHRIRVVVNVLFVSSEEVGGQVCSLITT